MVGLFFGTKYPKTRIGLIELDATISETHTFSSNVTQFPVENGSVISDHIYNQPINLSMDCLISDSPITENFIAGFDIINSVRQFFSNTNTGSTRSISVFEDLLDLYEKRELITVVTGIRIYKSMAITSISIPRSGSTGQALNFRIDLTQVRFGSSYDIPLQRAQYVEMPGEIITRDQVASNNSYQFISRDPTTSLKDQAQSNFDMGVQTLQVPKPAVTEQVAGLKTKLDTSTIFSGIRIR